MTEIGLGTLLFDVLLGKTKTCKSQGHLLSWGRVFQAERTTNSKTLKWEGSLKEGTHLAAPQISKHIVSNIYLETRRHLFNYIPWKTSLTNYLFH